MTINLQQSITEVSIKRYRLVTVIMVLFTVGLGSLIPLIQVDTDPENMLSEDEAVRVFHHLTKEKFSLSDIVVLGIIND